MLGLAKRVKAKILQASTSEVYGDSKIHPQQESYWGHVNPIGERACYNEGKRAAETLFINYYRQNQVKVKIIRIFNTYGPRMQLNDGRVISNFIIQALKNEPITVNGDGNQTRSFCYVDDLIKGMVGMMQTPDTVTGPLNMGNPHEITILDLATRIIALTGSRSELRFQNIPVDDPAKRQPDIDLETGLLKTIDYFRKTLAGTPTP